MGGQGAPAAIPESVGAMLRIIDGLKPEHSGKSFGPKGEEIPW
jgi:hypothetical protein